ncbi:hypothetical protein NCCP2495_31110 [Dietzia sp. NCCP-2495]|uniref:HNH endonuclease signature motif containing protein n=1 Tax=Dietzia sp. NCCP-2495 TaxID=2934675 RepID=UPI00222E97CD|nr:HNH endonuclease signature motif containing protein [Dietzia sp. NCCP-2495]GLB65231.1 hypothetical protein NCCP2495_31110 [Dietzia sp. NCCP-2495]
MGRDVGRSFDDDDTVTPLPGPAANPVASVAFLSGEATFPLGSEAAISAFADAARAGWEAENRATALRLKTAHGMMVQCVEHADCSVDPDDSRPGFTVVDPSEMAAAHLVAMYPISTGEAEELLSFAADLHFKYPAVLQAMSDGRMDMGIAKVMATQMRSVDESVLPLVQKKVVDAYLESVESGERPSRKTVRARIDKIITKHDRDAVSARKKDAVRDRCVRISKGQDGMASLYAILNADEAAVLAESIKAKVAADRAAEDAAASTDTTATDAATADGTGTGTAAATGTTTGADNTPGSGAPYSDSGMEKDGYSYNERRADALMSLLLGDRAPNSTGTSLAPESDTSTDPSTGSPASTPAGTGTGTGTGLMLRPKITVIAPTGGNLTGWNDQARVEFARTGEGALQSLLEMLATSDGATLQQIDPTPGADDAPDTALRYRPGAALSHRVRLRDGTCRHPGCSIPADDCDLDHVVPFNHSNPEAGGHTVESNLACLCRFHHRLKTFIGWEYRLEPDGTLEITNPNGKTMFTRPDGPLAEFRREQVCTEASAWERQQRRNPDPDKPSASGDAASRNYTEQTSWSRRQARAQARQEKERFQNAADWQARDEAAAARAKARADARAAADASKRTVETIEGPNGTTITVVRGGPTRRPVRTHGCGRRFPDHTDYLDVQPCADDDLDVDSFISTLDPTQPVLVPLWARCQCSAGNSAPRSRDDLADSTVEHALWAQLDALDLPPF